MDSRQLTGEVYLDLKKAFDTVDASILLSKLEMYGIRNNELRWFHNCLTGRSQVVSVNGAISDSHDIDVGVPQGSVLGPLPLLFTRVVSHLARSDTPNITGVVSRLARSDTPNIVVTPWVQSPIRPHNHRRGYSEPHVLNDCMHIHNIQQSGRSVKSMNAKNTKKSTIHENADANITCEFGDGDISRSRSRLPHTHTASHTVSSIIKLDCFY